MHRADRGFERIYTMRFTKKEIMVLAVIGILLAAAGSFVAGAEYQKAQPKDIVIVGVDAQDELIQSDILPITTEHGIRFPVWENVTEYRLTYGH
jgi:hypothetical protein